MAERSTESSAGAGSADFSRASNRIGIPVGDLKSAAARGTKENPVIAPPALRLTTAVTCCHQALLPGCISSPPSSARLENVKLNRSLNCQLNYANSLGLGSC